MQYDYDLFVIGAGSGGLAAAKRAAKYGAKVAIAEADLVGGTCVIRGCVPKKLMVYASQFAHVYDDAIGYGWSAVQPSFDWSKLINSVQTEVKRLSKLHTDLLTKAGITLINGFVRFLDPHTLLINNQEKITAEKILIAVGGEAIKPRIPGIEHTITSKEIFLLPSQPKSIAVIGSGYIGVEFAGILNSLGTKVTQIIRKDYVLGGFDPDICIEVQEGMKKHGIEFITNTSIERIDQVENGLQLTLSTGEETQTLTVDTILYAVGRKPKLNGLGLENAEVKVTQAAICVDLFSRTSQHNIFAVGDCTNRKNLTPVAIAEGRAFADSEFGNNPHHISYSNIPSAIFSYPEAASVGLTEIEAEEQYGEDILIYKSRFRPMYYSLAGGEEKTLMKLIVEKQTDKILGAHIVGDYAAEIMQGVAIAVNMGATKKDFDTTIAIHPSSAEEFVTMT
jgi:glutathione reductase (NADPH)